jgi:hypothetical protein
VCGREAKPTMMSLHKLTAESGNRYLLRCTATGDGDTPTPGGVTGYYTSAGTPPGQWTGAGLAGLADGHCPPAGLAVDETSTRSVASEHDLQVTGAVPEHGERQPAPVPLQQHPAHHGHRLAGVAVGSGVARLCPHPGERVGSRVAHCVPLDATLPEPLQLVPAHPYLLGQPPGVHGLGDPVGLGGTRARTAAAYSAPARSRAAGSACPLRRSLDSEAARGSPRRCRPPCRPSAGRRRTRSTRSGAATPAGIWRWTGTATPAARCGTPAAVPVATAGRSVRRRSERPPRTPPGTWRS